MHNRGFTLIELSIVLVILGLIVGGIVGGKALIHQAELNKIIADFKGYQVAFNAYKMQYDAFPGDHKEATQYWPAKTTDGDGDGIVCDGNCPGAGFREYVKTWQHLSLADLVPFTPDGSLTPPLVIGGNQPKGTITGQTYLLQSYGTTSLGTVINAASLYGRSGIYLRAADVSAATDDGVFLTPKDARNIDTKIDDGKPASGQLMANEGTGASLGDCVAGITAFAVDTAGTNQYNVGTTSIACTLEYLMQ